MISAVLHSVIVSSLVAVSHLKISLFYKKKFPMLIFFFPGSGCNYVMDIIYSFTDSVLICWFRWKLRDALFSQVSIFLFQVSVCLFEVYVIIAHTNFSVSSFCPPWVCMACLEEERGCADAVSSVGCAFSYQPKRRHAFCPVPTPHLPRVSNLSVLPRHLG